eukprot:6986375-Pyramimonas_sp.AAC.1
MCCAQGEARANGTCNCALASLHPHQETAGTVGSQGTALLWPGRCPGCNCSEAGPIAVVPCTSNR